MKKIVLFVAALICATGLFASAPRVPVGAKSVSFMNVDLVLENKDWKLTWDGFMKSSHDGASLNEYIAKAENNKHLREFVSANQFEAKSICWLMLVQGKFDVRSIDWLKLVQDKFDKRRIDSLLSSALVISGSIDATRLCKSFSDIVNGDKPGSVKEIESDKHSAYVIDVESAFGNPEIARYVGGTLYYAPLDDFTIVIASNEKMLRAFQDVYSGKRNESSRFASIFKREPNRILASRSLNGADCMLQTIRTMHLLNMDDIIPPYLHPFFDIVKNVDGCDSIVSTAGREQRFEFLFAMKDVASAVECEEYLSAFAAFAHLCVLAGDNVVANPLIKPIIESLSVERVDNRVSLSFQFDYFKTLALLQQFDGDDDDKDEIDL